MRRFPPQHNPNYRSVLLSAFENNQTQETTQGFKCLRISYIGRVRHPHPINLS